MIVEGDNAVLFVNLHDFNVVLPLALAQNVGLVSRRRASRLGRSGHFEKNLQLAENVMMPLGVILGGGSVFCELAFGGGGGFRPKMFRATTVA